jgi:hypothetical protein
MQENNSGDQVNDSFDQFLNSLIDAEEKELAVMSRKKLLRYGAESRQHIKQLYVLLTIAGTNMAKMAGQQYIMVEALNAIIGGLTAKKLDNTEVKNVLSDFAEIQSLAKKYTA